MNELGLESADVISVYDSTLRDGAQMAGINFSLQDKFDILKSLVDELGIELVEIYPFSNPKDMELIKYVKERYPKYLKNLVAFGSTRNSKKEVYEDENLKVIVESGLNKACIFGKSWDFHLPFIHASSEENLKMIEESVAYLKEHGFTVYFDAEHFFDGYKSNRSYAMQTLRSAERAGADALILCDTNGGTLPHEVYDIVEDVIRETKADLGIHAHNDAGMGDANSIAAVKACLEHNRACQVQGTINGLGERTGNADLTTIIPNLVLKMGLNVVPRDKLKNLTAVSNLIYEIANLIPPTDAPFVGYNAFSHKGGMHIAAIRKDYRSYEHINPEDVGNKRRVLISEMSGKSAIIYKMDALGITIDKNDPLIAEILRLIKVKESHGYTYEGADASLEILIRGMLNDPKMAANYFRTYYFEVDYFRVITDVRNVFDEQRLEIFNDANIRIMVNDKEGNKREYHTAATGNGPVNAIDNAFKKGLIHFYPVLKEIELVDFKVRIANAAENEHGTASRVRVLVKTRDKDGTIWGTIGSHVNIIVASFVALLDSYVYKLMKEKIPPHKPKIRIDVLPED
ncbi:MAG: citramalate synthase [Promethearchaeota archaeon]